MKKLIALGLMIATSSTFAMVNPFSKLNDDTKELQPEKPIVNLVVPHTVFDENYWLNFAQTLQSPSLPSNLVINLDISGYGGDALLMNTVLGAMKSATDKGITINANVNGAAISAHAMLVCGASKVTLSPGSSLVFHGMGDYVSLFGGLITYRAHASEPAFTALQNNILYSCVKKGILTAKDVQAIKDGNRVEIINTGVNIVKFTLPDFGNGYELYEQIASAFALLALFLVLIAAIKRI